MVRIDWMFVTKRSFLCVPLQNSFSNTGWWGRVFWYG